MEKLLGRLFPAVRRLISERDQYKASIGDRSWWIHHRHQILSATPVVSSASVKYNKDVVERLLRAYQSSNSGQHGADSMWKTFFNNFQLEIHQVFMGSDFEKAFLILSNPQESNLFFGFDDLCKIFEKQKNDTLPGMAQREQDNLIRLAESLGAIDVENPENDGSWRRYKDASTDEIVASIEARLNREIVFPDLYPGAAGIKSFRGIISYRAIQALYLAIKLKQLASERLPGNPSVKICEIGAGLGRSAYYASQFDLRDYTLVDIPMTAISQGFHLIQLLGEDAVVLPGEKRTSNRQIQILHPDEFFASDQKYDIVANVDSLTELGHSLAKQYIDKVSQSAQFFLSMNHEANGIRVFDLVKESRRPFKIQRFPYWMRRGYVEELIQFI